MSFEKKKKKKTLVVVFGRKTYETLTLRQFKLLFSHKDCVLTEDEFEDWQ